MKARKVKRLDPEAPLAEGARRIVLVRLGELESFIPRVLDPGEVEALHDMRIAAKRLRYVLELTEPCFGAEARYGYKQAKELQEVLGEVHDCDEMLALVRRRRRRLRGEDLVAVRASQNGARDLDPKAARAAPNRTAYRGLETLATYLRARRELLYGQFVDRWSKLEKEGFRRRLEDGLDVAPEVG